MCFPPLAVVAFLLPFLRFLYDVRTDVVTLYSVQPASIHCTKRSRVNASNSLQCGRWVRLSLSLQQYTLYFRGIDTDHAKDYAIFILVDTTAYTKHYTAFSRGGYLKYSLRGIFEGRRHFLLHTTGYYRGGGNTVYWCILSKKSSSVLSVFQHFYYTGRTLGSLHISQSPSRRHYRSHTQRIGRWCWWETHVNECLHQDFPRRNRCIYLNCHAGLYLISRYYYSSTRCLGHVQHSQYLYYGAIVLS